MLRSNRGVLQVPQGDVRQGEHRARLLPRVIALRNEGAEVPAVPSVPPDLFALVNYLAYDPAGKLFGLVNRLQEKGVKFADDETRAELAARCDAYTRMQQPQVQGWWHAGGFR